MSTKTCLNRIYVTYSMAVSDVLYPDFKESVHDLTLLIPQEDINISLGNIKIAPKSRAPPLRGGMT